MLPDPAPLDAGSADPRFGTGSAQKRLIRIRIRPETANLDPDPPERRFHLHQKLNPPFGNTSQFLSTPHTLIPKGFQRNLYNKIINALCLLLYNQIINA